MMTCCVPFPQRSRTHYTTCLLICHIPPVLAVEPSRWKLAPGWTRWVNAERDGEAAWGCSRGAGTSQHSYETDVLVDEQGKAVLNAPSLSMWSKPCPVRRQPRVVQDKGCRLTTTRVTSSDWGMSPVCALMASTTESRICCAPASALAATAARKRSSPKSW